MSSPQASEPKGRWTPAFWTLAVIVIGVVLGAGLALLPRRMAHTEIFAILTSADIVVSTVSMSLIVCLLYIHSKTYAETKAPLALGLFIVLGAFLFQTVLTSPLFAAAFDKLFLGGRPSLALAADTFESFAFSVLFYLSL